MDNFLDSLLSSPSWSDMNDSASRSWVGNSSSQTDSLFADSMESFQGNATNSAIPTMPSNHITGNITAEDLAMAHDNTTSIFSNGSLKYGINKGSFLPGNLSHSQQPNHKTQQSHGIEASEESFSISGTVTINSTAIPFGLELSPALAHSTLTNPSTPESSGNEPLTFVQSFGEAHSISSVSNLWPPYAGISSLSGREKVENFSSQGIPNSVDLLTENQNELASNLVTFGNGNQMKITGLNSPPHYQGTTEATSIQIPSFHGVSQMSLTKTTGMQTNPQFNGNSLNHQACHSFNNHQHVAQTSDVDCNVAAKPRVRARRGQATDPHSIAERLRREKIAERMKNLQELVPNFNKTDKASMLDEIIDYVKFLQLQVKVLSMSRLGAAGAVVPLITDVRAEDTGSLSLSSISQVVDLLDSEENLAFEQEVVKLMESNVTNAMQYLQNKGFCLMPIALATAISNQKFSSAATLPNHRNQNANEMNGRNEEAKLCNGLIVKQEAAKSMCNGRLA